MRSPLIIPNLTPSEGPVDFYGSLHGDKQRTLSVIFRDPRTYCQTPTITLHFSNRNDALRWLYVKLEGKFGQLNLQDAILGNSFRGSAPANLLTGELAALAKEMILTADISTLWYVGAYVPFDFKEIFPMTLWLERHPIPERPNGILKALAKSFRTVTFPPKSETEKHLLRCEHILLRGSTQISIAGIRGLKALFAPDNPYAETSILSQLQELEAELSLLSHS